MSSSRFNSPGPGPTPQSSRHEFVQSPINSFHPTRTGPGHGAAPLSNLTNEQIKHLRRQSHLSTLSLSPGRPQAQLQPQSATTSGTARPIKARDRYSLADESSVRLDGQGEDGEEWLMVDRIRCWRNDAMTQHLYGTAQFWGAKVFAITDNPNDAFWLAQTHFLVHQYSQAEKILTALRPPSPGRAASSSAARRLTDSSLACRYLAAQCQVRLGKWDEALEMVGRNGGLGGEPEGEGEGEGQGDGGIKLTASTAHLRGLIHLHQGANELAKDAFVEALTLDVKCFESFEMLVSGEMMTHDEEWEFIQGLPYLAQTGEEADFVRMMYTVRLKKIKPHPEMAVARDRLRNEFGLSEDPDVMFGLADELYSGMRFAECYKLTTKILSIHSSHRPTLPLHLSCMHHLPHLRSRLFLLAHELVENEPDDAVSWYAVGLWYFSGKRWEESRRFFGKAVLLDSRFGPAWLAFAHSYAFEGEHDQAITAYSTALRHFQGSHLPLLCIGMQHLGLANDVLALEYLGAARDACGGQDPLVLNELGVVAVHEGKVEEAVELFQGALRLAKGVQGSPAAWTTTHLNLGHAWRKLGRLDQAQRSFRRVLELNPRLAGAYAGLGLVEHLLGHYQESIARYHESLSLAPGDPVTCDLLKLVLDDTVDRLSTVAGEFPGLPRSVLASIDEQVAALDEEVRAEGRGGEEEEGQTEQSVGGDMLEGESGMDETMEDATMDQTMEDTSEL